MSAVTTLHTHDDEAGDERASHGVPRIVIDVFHESPVVEGMMGQLAEDRRLSRVRVHCHGGGLPGAIAHYRNRHTPNLVVVESATDQDALFSLLGSFSEVCDPGTKVIVLGAVNDIAVYRHLIRQGVSEYFPLPVEPLQLAGAITGLYTDPDAPPVGRVFAFTGMRGGTGASTLAHNVAWMLNRESDADVTLIDLDLSFGTGGLDFNLNPEQGLAEALASPGRLDDMLLERLLTSCGEGLNLFAAPCVLDQDYAPAPEEVENILTVAKSAAPFVVVDLPHVWNPWTKHVLLMADHIVLVSSPDLVGLRNTRSVAAFLKARRRNDCPPFLVLNQLGIGKGIDVNPGNFAEAADLEVTATLAFDPQLFRTASNNGEMIAEVDATSATTVAVQDLTRRIAGFEAPKDRKSALLAIREKMTWLSGRPGTEA